MELSYDEEKRLTSFINANTLKLSRQLGFGIHGKVFAVKDRTGRYESVVKIFESDSGFARERDVYLRLQKLNCTSVCGCNIPRLLSYDDEMFVIHIGMVSRPFALDFASAYLDSLPEGFPPFGPEWHEEKKKQFGEEHWPKVLEVLRELKSMGIYQTDVSPSNIAPVEL